MWRGTECKERIQMEAGVPRSSHMATASFMPPPILYPWQYLWKVNFPP